MISSTIIVWYGNGGCLATNLVVAAYGHSPFSSTISLVMKWRTALTATFGADADPRCSAA